MAAQTIPAAAAPAVGDKAPLVKGVDQDGNKWKLADDIGKNVVLLYFYPRDNTPGCTKEACSLRDKIGDLKAEGVKVIVERMVPQVKELLLHTLIERPM